LKVFLWAPSRPKGSQRDARSGKRILQQAARLVMQDLEE
jgi:hypothetical protein